MMNELIKGEDRYRILLDRITDGFIALDKSFRYIYANHRIGELVNRDPQSLIGKNVWEEFPEAVGSYTYHAFNTAMNEQRFISNVDYFAPLDLWQENYIYPSVDGLSVFIKDISERKKLERELMEQERKQHLQIIASALEAQEKERTEIAQELHDNVNQIVTGTKLIMALLKDNPEKVPEMIPLCIDNLEKIIFENRKIAHELMTPHFTEVNLEDELHGLFNSMLDIKGTKTLFDLSGFDESLLSQQIKLTIYRIAQEQCININKHAKATRVTVSLTIADDCAKMIIADNGKGMSDTKSNGIGFKSMEARLRIVNGKMETGSTPGEGFKLYIKIPLA